MSASRFWLQLGEDDLALWVVHTGYSVMREPFALHESCVVTGWEELPDLSAIKSRDDLNKLMVKVYAAWPPNTVVSWVGQLWKFLHEMKIGDHVVVPVKSPPSYAIGVVSGQYKFRQDGAPHSFHTRPVQWLTTNLPRERISDDMYYSFKAHMSIYTVSRNNIEQRLLTIIGIINDETA